MWLIHKDFGGSEDDYLLTLGKSNCLCQHFETICREVLMWAGFAEAIRDGNLTEDKDGNPIWPSMKLLDVMLSRRITELQRLLKPSEKDIAVLHDARQSRNFIVHASSEPLFYGIGRFGPSRDEHILSELPLLYGHVRNVAKGDTLVSKWNYEICEKEPAPVFYASEYVETVSAWVFSKYQSGEYDLEDAD